MATHVMSNGSRWMGQPHASIEDLFELLAVSPLDDTYAPFIETAPLQKESGELLYPEAPATVRIYGNFRGVSHVFTIDTDDSALIARFAAAFVANKVAAR